MSHRFGQFWARSAAIPNCMPPVQQRTANGLIKELQAGRSASEGVGLGLSLVAEHVGLHGGRVWVEDRADGESGARFVVDLPVNWQ